jgi:Bacterial Ig-like domain (group 3)
VRPYLARSAAGVAALAAAAVLVTGGIAAPAGAGAAPPTGQAPALTPNPSLTYNFLQGVSAVSGSDAWAVGSYNDTTTGASKTLILHWNGTAWRQVKSPNPGPVFSELHGVSAVSGSDAWAVGDYWNRTGTAYDSLILHWNGTAWTQVNSPNPSPAGPFSSNYLLGVSARSGSDAWAVGNYDNNGVSDSLVLHWNGTAWSQVNSPTARYTDFGLEGVSAVSGSDAWAVGGRSIPSDGGRSATLILHWGGTAWTQVNSPSPGSGLNGLVGVSAVSGSDAWAVGSSSSYDTPYVSDTLILHWNGTAWTQVHSPSPSSVSYNELHGVSAVSGSDAWAVGFYDVNEIGGSKTLILHWNGTAWTQVQSPNPSCPDYYYSDNSLYGVSARSGSDAWAVGDYGDCTFATGPADTLVAHWNGTAWVNASAIPTSTRVSSSSNPVTTGRPVTYTATVAPKGTVAPGPQGGTVAFYDNGSLISSCSHKVLGSRSATCRVTYAAAGSHAIKAHYSGYADYAGSTSPTLTETVKTPATTSVPISPR